MFYYSEEERNQYLNLWKNKLSEPVLSYTDLENQFYNDVQSEHYIDNGCLCKGCLFKRSKIFESMKKGLIIKEKINHTEIVNNIINNKNKSINKINKINNKFKKTMNINVLQTSQKIKNNLMTSLLKT